MRAFKDFIGRHLSPKAFELLRLLIDARPRVAHKAELMQRLWFYSLAEEGKVIEPVWQDFAHIAPSSEALPWQSRTPPIPLRAQLARVLDWEEAHVGFDKAIDGIPPDKRGVLAPGLASSLLTCTGCGRIVYRTSLTGSSHPVAAS